MNRDRSRTTRADVDADDGAHWRTGSQPRGRQPAVGLAAEGLSVRDKDNVSSAGDADAGEVMEERKKDTEDKRAQSRRRGNVGS
jgi:hypothetical protein